MDEKQLSYIQRNDVPGISKVFSIVVAILPQLAQYASGIPGFSIADVCLVVFVGLAMLARGSNNSFKVQVAPLVLGIITLITFTFFACVLGFPSRVLDVVIRTTRYCFYIVAIFTAGKRLLDIPTLKKWVKGVSFAASVFIMFQFLVYNSTEIVVKGQIPFLKLYVEQYGTQDYTEIYEQFMYRPTSFFLEPAHYARYCILGIILYLFDNEAVNNKAIICALACAVGIILSTSSQGYFLLAVVTVLFLFTGIKKVRTKTTRVVLYIIVALLPILIYYILKLPIVKATLERTFEGDITNRHTALGGRLGGFLVYLKLPLINKLIGTGFGNVPEEVWLSSAAYWLYGSGIIVFLIYVYFLFQAFFQLDRKGKYILFTIAFLFITDDSFYSYMIVLYFSLILFKSKRSQV